MIGHLYPVYFRFQGGKGVATAAGMLLGLYPPAALLALAIRKPTKPEQQPGSV